jgi:hypothetical protein
MKGSKNFEDILKSDNDVSLGRGARLKIKKNFDIPEANDKPKKKKKTDGTENETSLSINRTMDPISRKVVPENQNAEIVCASYNAVHADDITIDKEAMVNHDAVFPLLEDDWNLVNSDYRGRSGM